ncbi:unnamed protein product [Lathyrus sativus]|nr:unnamed protein product [Lathyrus sativus]
MEVLTKSFIPFWMFVSTIFHRKMNEINKDIRYLLKYIINKRKKALKIDKCAMNDLLTVLLEPNHKEIEEN